MSKINKKNLCVGLTIAGLSISLIGKVAWDTSKINRQITNTDEITEAFKEYVIEWKNEINDILIYTDKTEYERLVMQADSIIKHNTVSQIDDVEFKLKEYKDKLINENNNIIQEDLETLKTTHSNDSRLIVIQNLMNEHKYKDADYIRHMLMEEHLDDVNTKEPRADE